jgi:hypothetical protein
MAGRYPRVSAHTRRTSVSHFAGICSSSRFRNVAGSRGACAEVAAEIRAEREEANSNRNQAHHLTEHAGAADTVY